MEPAPQNAPTPHEVQRQADRMLASQVLASAPRLSRLLRYIIDATLPDDEGKTDPAKLTEHQIGFAVLDNYDPHGSAVRTYVTNLRTKIDKYYTEFGADDLILIEVLPGGYRAVFSYNPKSPADKYYRRGLLQIGGFVPSEREHSSLRLLKEAIEADPNHAPAHAAKAEAELREAMYRRSIPPHNPLAAAEASALAALRLQPKLWRAHVALGAVHCCRHEWEEAGKSFDTALALAPNATRDHSWYSGFLLATGREQEALRLSRLRAEAEPEDLSAQIALGFFLYMARRFKEADEFLSEVVERCPQSWLARIVLECVHLVGCDPFEALLSIDEAHRILSEQSVWPSSNKVFPGLLNLCHMHFLAEGDRRFALEMVETAIGHDRWAVYFDKAAADHAPVADDWDRGHFDTYIPYWTPLQLALGFIGLEEKESAIAALTRAVNEGDPLTAWLHLLPLFDPLRGDPAFQALIKRMNFPSPSLK